jgi:CspA family cold shock protein
MAQIGTVKWFNTQTGYGFIEPNDGGKDVLVHISAVERSGLDGLVEGEMVEFEITSDPRNGKQSASDLKPVR